MQFHLSPIQAKIVRTLEEGGYLVRQSSSTTLFDKDNKEVELRIAKGTFRALDEKHVISSTFHDIRSGKTRYELNPEYKNHLVPDYLTKTLPPIEVTQ